MRVLEDAEDSGAGQSVTDGVVVEAKLFRAGHIDAVHAALRADPNRAVAALVDRANEIVAQRLRIAGFVAISAHAMPPRVVNAQAVERADPDAAAVVFEQ